MEERIEASPRVHIQQIATNPRSHNRQKCQFVFSTDSFSQDPGRVGITELAQASRMFMNILPSIVSAAKNIHVEVHEHPGDVHVHPGDVHEHPGDVHEHPLATGRCS